MEETTTFKKIHEGHNAQKIREARGMPQKVVAEKLGCVQSYVAKLESMEVLPEKARKQLAEIFNVDESLITSMQIDPDRINLTVQNNTFEEGSQSNVIGSSDKGKFDNNHDNVYNPVDEVIKLTQEKEELYKQLLEKEQQRADKFCSLFEDLTKQIAQLVKK